MLQLVTNQNYESKLIFKLVFSNGHNFDKTFIIEVTNKNDESKGRSIAIRFGFSIQLRFNITITMFNKGS
jgi:hypothetical protein